MSFGSRGETKGESSGLGRKIACAWVNGATWENKDKNKTV